MKLALVTQHFHPHFEGGTEAVVRAQARELAALGHEVRVVSGSDRAHAGEDEVRARVDGIEVTLLPRLVEERYDFLLERPRLAELVVRNVADAELVHVHHWSTLNGTLARELGRTRPVVLTLHDLFLTCPRFFRVPVAPVEECPAPGDFEPCARCCASAAPGWSHERLEGELVRRDASFKAELAASSRVVVPSRAHLENLRRFLELPDELVRVVAHGRLRELEPVGEAWFGEGPLRVLFIGHRSEVKGVLDLVRAAASLPAAERGRLELVLLGDEVVPGFDDELRREGRGVRLAFAGDYSPGELSELLRAAGGAHLGAFPSRGYESYGLVPDELQALGLPVWVTDRGAPKERIGRAGRVLPAADPEAWGRALSEVLAAPDSLEAERRAIPPSSRTARDAALELEALYAELLDGPR